MSARGVLGALLLQMLPLMLNPASAVAGLRWLRMEEPRNFGYFVGDTLQRHAYILVDPDDTLQAASLPKPGAVNYWLDLVSVEVRESRAQGGKLYRVTLVYQNFYVPLDPRKLTVPEWPLQLGGGSAVIPAFAFTASPIRELFPEKSGETVDTFLKPDARAALVSAGWAPHGLALSAAVALLTLALLAWHYAWWPFGARPDRPFTRAARKIAALAGNAVATANYRAALLALHRAFDAAAKRRLLADDVDGFLAQHPEFAACRAEIAKFFQSSREVFFGGSVAPLMPLDAVETLAAQLSAAERTR
ncbi:mxaA protein [Rhodopseudomonas rhenobacensis]|uniref:MxaA protein n=1 Tax=Rhodopseudomonas rhenobacensis TaxID=87461 RepID=A0A7W7Z347_9BRAD|nr:nonribosomal peptide synthetase MxaA [Rhodopseudomonas rhenobacensis]MBB5047138.1 mxaA protein [Rhodopseudomonas rhenobacensis]